MLASLSCGGADLILPSDSGPVQVMMLEGDRQVGVAGARLQDSLLVRVVDTLGIGVPGRVVTWSVPIGGGSVLPQTDTSDTNGFASTTWTLGEAAGANAVRALVSGADFVTFTAVGSSGSGGGSVPSAARSTISADPSSISVTGSSTITVTARDDQGNAVEGAIVVLQAGGTGTTLTQPSVPTDQDGTTSGTLVSAVPGTILVSAIVNGSVLLSQTAEVTVSETSGPVDHFVFRLQPHDVHTRELVRARGGPGGREGQRSATIGHTHVRRPL